MADTPSSSSPSPIGPLTHLRNALTRQLTLLAPDDALRGALQSALDDVQARLAALRSGGGE